VASAGGRVAGYAIGYLYNTRAEIDSIAVSPARRRLGIARTLIVRLKRMIRRRGCASLSLSVRLNNIGAIELYRELGFRRERRLSDYYKDGAPAWRMKASLVG
jgi:ribosomal protein S18 acetylase RimI-like enzyme